MNKTGWIIFSTAVVLLLGGLVVWTRMTNPPLDVSNVNTGSVLAATEESGTIADRTKGSSENTVVLVEYGDYQCPSCAGANANVNKLVDEYGDKLTFVFRNFPLTSIHPNAKAAAAVAEAAGQQDKFWEMHNLLYDNQSDWASLDASKRTDVFNQYADSLNLDITKFTADLTDKTIAQKIKFDIALGKKDGAEATPAFYLNGKKVDEAAASALVQGDTSAVKALIDELVK